MKIKIKMKKQNLKCTFETRETNKNNKHKK